MGTEISGFFGSRLGRSLMAFFASKKPLNSVPIGSSSGSPICWICDKEENVVDNILVKRKICCAPEVDFP